MDSFLNLFRVATIRRYLRIGFWILKHLMALLSASLEVFTRRNLGRRYMLTVVAAFLLCTLYAAIPREAPLLHLFLFGFLIMMIYHFCYNAARTRAGEPQPHSLSTGDSWDLWQRLGIQQTTVQRYLEPAFCFLISLPLSAVDPFLQLWLKASALALLVKEQIQRHTTTRRIVDTIDARLEAQALNTALNQHQQRPNQGAQRLHRARLPGQVRRPHP